MKKLNILLCDKCEKEIGYLYFTRWVDYDGVYCMECADQIFSEAFKESGDNK